VTARLTDATKNALLSGTDLATLITHLSLHSGFPPAGGNELAGGAPAYGRKAVSLAAPSAGCRAITAAQTFDVAAGSNVRCVGFYNALTSGTLAGYALAGSAATIAIAVAAADLTNNDIQSEAHGLVANDTVLFWPTIGATLPNGLAEDTIYFVIATGLTTDSFRVSLTQGGAAVDITGAGDGDAQKFVTETYAGQGQYQVSSLQVCLPG
jgi:hypothetical protein